MKILLMIAAFFLPLLETPSTQGGDSAYLPLTGPCNLSFPKDHGSHPGYRTEWWYYTGNLTSQGREEFGFQLTFFRRQICPPGAEKEWPTPSSAWRTQQVYLAHAAISDITGKRFYHAEKMTRGTLGLGGVEEKDGSMKVFTANWSLFLHPHQHILSARSDDFSFNLNLKPQKEPVPHGISGYSRKGKAPEQASCYYSFPRLAADGTLTIDNRSFSVEGTAWMDHEFSSAPLDKELVGWDWFSLQLSNDTELMIYLLRREDGSWSPASSGTFVHTSGKFTPLNVDAFMVEVLDHWDSPHSKARYPSRWNLRVPFLQLDLIITARFHDQEMLTPESTRVTYWEGSVSCDGTLNDQPITARGYVELTGYAQAMRSPF